MNAQDVSDGFASFLEAIGPETYGFQPASPTIPCFIAYPEETTFTTTEPMTWIIRVIGGSLTEARGAQEKVYSWTSDDGPESIRAAVLTDQTLGGVVSTVLPIGARNFGAITLNDGRDVFAAELVFSVWR